MQVTRVKDNPPYQLVILPSMIHYRSELNGRVTYCSRLESLVYNQGNRAVWQRFHKGR